MKLTDLFLKDVNRSIETVIKADDQDHIYIEVDEYVVTKEIAKKIADFFSSYNDYQGVNGVWISGFFGSGKSHLLKILSYILENKEYDGTFLGEMFALKIEDDDLLKGDVLKATRIPSESILFNIDQQAQITSKADQDAILNVFYKVFNDHLGYYGGQKHVAEFERWLDSEGIYSKFMELYEAAAKEHWTVGRRKYFAPKTKSALASALAKIQGGDENDYKNIIDTLRKDSKISVEDFCEKVSAYIETKAPGFRLNFFVDEVGQFISENTKLMLNLQTIAETLATKCKGQAWVFATAQEDLERVVGDESAIQTEDFSKIQGRFKLRVSLTSANVDEVIERRLLAKTLDAKNLLSQNWKDQKANLSTILTFSESGVQFRKYQGEKDYVYKFPFIPYQFDLFQQCIKELSKHNAFQGKHASVGERSMLGVFQEVLRSMESADTTTLVSFDKMFEGIRSTIRGEIQNAITFAEKNLFNEPLALKVLKALFLVKYYSNFKTTARNISILMLPSTKVDLKKHEEEVTRALNLLENQTYIQRNAEVYEFLTDDEKDVENEIKNTDIDDFQINNFFKETLFDAIIGDNRIRFVENKQDYEFTKKIDGHIHSREKELIIEILTPNSDQYGREEFYKAHTMGYNTMALFVLPQAERLLQDVRLYLKTEKYYKQNISATNNPTLSRIIHEKQQQNVQRKRQLALLLKGLLGNATVYMNGTKHPIGNTTDGKTKVINAFQDLVKIAYPSLKMLGNINYDEDGLKNIIRSRQDDLFKTDDKTLTEAESEVYSLIVRRKKQSSRTSITDLKEYFTKKPFGWYMNAILCVTARLYKRGKIEARQDANLLSDEDFLSKLLNNRTFAHVLLDPQMDFDQSLVRKIKQIYQEFFDETCPETEARDVANKFKEKAREKAAVLNQLIGNKTQYPFLASLEQLSILLGRLAGMEYSILINKINEFEDDLLDQKEDILDPIQKFWNGEQKKIFDRIIQFLESDQSNFEYVDSEELEMLKEVRIHPKPYAGNTMKTVKGAMDALSKKIITRIEEEKQKTLSLINEEKEQLSQRTDFKQLNESQQEKILKPFEDLASKAKDQRYIAPLRQYGEKGKELSTERLNEIQKLTAKAEEPIIQYIRKAKVIVSFEKTELLTEKDVEEYTEKMKAELLRHIRANRRIKL